MQREWEQHSKFYESGNCSDDNIYRLLVSEYIFASGLSFMNI